MKHTPDEFMSYFRQNYPGPHTIISKPDWHAPKIYRAAIDASAFKDMLEACKLALESLRAWNAMTIRLTLERSLDIEAYESSPEIKTLLAAIAKAEGAE